MVNPASNDDLSDQPAATLQADGVLTASPLGANGSKRYAYWLVAAFIGLALMALSSLVVALRAQERFKNLEQELVRRQQESQGLSSEARLLAKQSQDSSRESAAKVALLEARVSEVAIQRSQLEDLIQSMSRSRDENLVVDVEAGIRVAQQQSAITGSAEPLLAVLKQSDERLARVNQPRLEGVRRAIARDLDKVRAVGVADINSLVIKLDEAVRLVDELPLLSTAEQRKTVVPAAVQKAPSAATASEWAKSWGEGWTVATQRVWFEAKSLIRVTRIDQPEAMLLAPEQAFFLRENLKLRLLNARLALLSRQFDTAQSDLQSAQNSLERYFDRSARRTVLAADLVKQVAAQARQVTLPRPDDTLAALATASAGR